MDFKTIETERLVIRAHSPEDWRDLFEYLSVPETYIYEPGSPITADGAKKMSIERSGSDIFLPVILKENRKMIGHLYFNRTGPEEFMTRELGYIFNPRYHNKGYATEASAAILGYGFDDLHAHKIVAFCNPRNIASWRVLEKIGMEREGLFREKAFFRKDSNNEPVWHDCYAYGILRKQYDSRK
jgi:ribosomal-protein-alanine N-acetyltransferase